MQLNARNIGEIDRGQVGLAINHALKGMIQDVIDRHGDKAKRAVTIKLTATPVLDEASAALDTVAIQVEVDMKVPKRRNSKPYQMMPLGDGTLKFSPTSPMDPRQMPMFDGSTPLEGADGVRIDKATGELMEGNDDSDDDDGSYTEADEIGHD